MSIEISPNPMPVFSLKTKTPLAFNQIPIFSMRIPHISSSLFGMRATLQWQQQHLFQGVVASHTRALDAPDTIHLTSPCFPIKDTPKTRVFSNEPVSYLLQNFLGNKTFELEEDRQIPFFVQLRESTLSALQRLCFLTQQYFDATGTVFKMRHAPPNRDSPNDASFAPLKHTQCIHEGETWLTKSTHAFYQLGDCVQKKWRAHSIAYEKEDDFQTQLVLKPLSSPCFPGFDPKPPQHFFIKGVVKEETPSGHSVVLCEDTRQTPLPDLKSVLPDGVQHVSFRKGDPVMLSVWGMHFEHWAISGSLTRPRIPDKERNQSDLLWQNANQCGMRIHENTFALKTPTQRFEVSKNVSFLSQKGTLQWKTIKNMTWHATQDTSFHAKKMEWRTQTMDLQGNSFVFKSDLFQTTAQQSTEKHKTISIETEATDFNIQSLTTQADTFALNTSRSLHIQTPLFQGLGKQWVVENKHARIACLPSGTLKIRAKRVYFLGQDVSMKGDIRINPHHHPGSPS